MIHAKNIKDGYKICYAIGSQARLEILEYLLAHPDSNIDAIAKHLHVSNGALTRHMQILIDCNLVEARTRTAKHGKQKVCRVIEDKIIIDVFSRSLFDNRYRFSIPIGQYRDCDINPYCALVTKNGYIGERDDPRYFTYPERTEAAMLYFKRGYLTYALPKAHKIGETVKSASLSFEISAKPFGIGRTQQSAVKFYLCNTLVGSHIIDGEFTDRRALAPEWYNGCQYGRQKTLAVTRNGTFVDNVQISDITIDKIDFSVPSFSISTEDGLALFGEGFGDYDSMITYEICV